MSNEEVYSTVLRKNYANISKKLEFNGSTLLPLMLQEGLITENQKDHIEVWNDVYAFITSYRKDLALLLTLESFK